MNVTLGVPRIKEIINASKGSRYALASRWPVLRYRMLLAMSGTEIPYGLTSHLDACDRGPARQR
eukprot:1060706-Rhodomonas_salina.1